MLSFKLPIFPCCDFSHKWECTNPLTQEPAEVRSSLDHSHIVWGSKRNGWMRRLRRSKINHFLLSFPGQEKRWKKEICGRLVILFSLLLEQSCCVLPLLPSFNPSDLAGPRIRSKPLATRASIGNRSSICWGFMGLDP